MQIKDIYIQAFAGLKDFHYVPKPGLQVLFGHNESGKSTIMAFVRHIFFGLGNRSRDLRKNFRDQYRPWKLGKGEAFGGSICFELGGETYRLTRTFGEQKRQDEVSLCKLDGTPVSLPVDQEPGEFLLGLTEEELLASALVEEPLTHPKKLLQHKEGKGRDALATKPLFPQGLQTKSPLPEDLASGGGASEDQEPVQKTDFRPMEAKPEEGIVVSYQDLRAQLDQAKRALILKGTKNLGKIPQLEKLCADLALAYAQSLQADQRRVDLYESVAKEQAKIQEAKAKKQRMAEIRAYQDLAKEKKRLTALAKEVTACRALTQEYLLQKQKINPRSLSDGDLGLRKTFLEERQKMDRLKAAYRVEAESFEKRKARHQALLKETQDQEEALSNHRKEVAAKIKALEEKPVVSNRAQAGVNYGLIFLVMGFLLILGLLVRFLSPTLGGLLIVLAGLFPLGVLLYLYRFKVEEDKANVAQWKAREDYRQEILQRSQDIARIDADLSRLEGSKDQSTRAIEAIFEDRKKAKEALEAAIPTYQQAAAAYFGRPIEAAEIEGALEAEKTLAIQVAQAKKHCHDRWSTLQNLLQGLAPKDLPKAIAELDQKMLAFSFPNPEDQGLLALDANALKKEERSLEMTVELAQAAIQKASNDLAVLADRYVEPARLYRQLEEKKKELATWQRVEEVITMAQTVTDYYESHFEENLRPQISTLASQYLAPVSGSRFRELTLDQDHAVQVRMDKVGGYYHDAYYSAGTQDLFHLCLRLAVCHLLFAASTETGPLPIFLDDSLKQLDYERLTQTLQLLRKYSQEDACQIFYFAKDREVHHLAQDLSIPLFSLDTQEFIDTKNNKEFLDTKKL